MAFLVASASGKPKVMPDGKLSADPTCCNKRWFVVIYNSNFAKDDNFQVSILGFSIGTPNTIDNNSDTCTGRFWAESTSINATTLPGIVTCGIPNLQPTVFTNLLDFTLRLPASDADLKIESIQNNNNGNFGNVQMGVAVPDGFNWKICYTMPLFTAPRGDPSRAETNFYNFESGGSQSFYFDIPAVL